MTDGAAAFDGVVEGNIEAVTELREDAQAKDNDEPTTTTTMD